MKERDDIKLFTRELNRDANKKKKKKTSNIIRKSIKRQFFFLIIMLLIIIMITAYLNVIGKTTTNKVASISEAISSTGKIKDSNFVTINEDGGYYELDIDKAYEELEEWAKKNGINLRAMGLTKEIYGEMLKLEAETTLVSLGGTPVGENAVQGKIILYRKKSDGTIIPMSFTKKAQWDQNIITKRTNEISGLGIGATKASETEDMTTEESKRIWMALKTNGWSNMAIIGAMGNMYVESKYSSEKSEGRNNEESTEYTRTINKKEEEKENYINDGKGYGLIQWKSKEDKEGLYNLAKSNQVSIGDFAMQLKYMQSQAEKNEKMKQYIEGKNTEGKEITETEYAVTAFYEYWIKKNYEFEEKTTSDTERNEDELATRWKAGEEIEEEYVYNQRLGKNQIIGQQKIASISNNKFLGLNNNKNNIKVADAITRREENGTQTATSTEEKEKLDKYYNDNILPTFTVDNGNVVVGSLYTVEIRTLESDFAKEENSINKILEGAEDGSDINGGGNLAYQMEVREQTIDVSEVPSNANLSAATVTSMLITTPGDKTKEEVQKKFITLLEDAKKSQGTEVGIQDFITVVTTTQTEEMNLKFDYEWYRKSKDGDKEEEQDKKGTDEQEFKTTAGNTEYILDRDILHEQVKVEDVGYRTIITTEITTIPQAVVEKQKTVGKEVTYVYEENQEHEQNEATKIDFSDTDSEYTGWVECNKGGEGTQNSKVHEDYHKYLDSLGIDTTKEAEDEHKHLTQTATGRSIRKQVDTSRSIYMKVGESIVTNNANALETYIKEADPDEEMLRDYLKDAGVKEEEIDEVVDALLKAKKNSEKTDNGNRNGAPNSGGGSDYPKNQGGGGDPNPTDDGDEDSTGSDETKITIDWKLTNKLAKAAYYYITKGIKYVANGKDLKTGVNNPQFVYQLLKNETKMYTGEYVNIKEWNTKLEDYIVGNDISLAQEGDVIIYKKSQNDDGNRKICIYSGKNNIIMEVDTTGGIVKKLDLNTYTVDRIYRFNEDGSAPEIDPNIVRLIMIEPPSLKIEEKKEVQLKAITLPTSATKNVKINWKSENKKIATVNQDGKVSTLEYGNVTIIATTNNGKSAQAEIQIGKELQTKYTTDTKEELSGVVDKTKKEKRKNIGVYVGTNEKSVVDGGSYSKYKNIDAIAKKFMDTYGVNITCSEDIHPRYYIGYTKMNISKNNKDLNPLDNQEKIDIPRNTKIVVTKKEQGRGNSTGPYYKNSPIYMEIQFKDKDGNVRRFRLNYAYRYLFLNGWINMIGQRWSIAQAEEFVNKTCKADSRTNYCLWVNPYNKVAFLFKGSKGNWRVIRIMDAGNGRWQWDPSSSTSADTSYSLANAKNKNGQQKVNKRNGVIYDGLYYVMDYAEGNCIHAGSPLTYNTSHGCIAFSSEDAKYLYENIPIGTKVILY